jgi:dinuclear metal center YbgI/SA1388 family protein
VNLSCNFFIHNELRIWGPRKDHVLHTHIRHMTRLDELVSYTDELLETADVPDYPSAWNGLQLENSGEVVSIASAVDFSKRAIDDAIAVGANLLLVHHGMFWNGFGYLRGNVYRRFRSLIENDVAVYSSHLPLDRHPTLGNNVLLAKELGLTPNGGFANYSGIFIGLSGQSDVETSDLAQRASRFARKHGGDARVIHAEKGRRTRRWGMCTGAGASNETLKEAMAMQLDTLIVGEGPHHTAVQAEENGISIIYAGHYATETLGVRALGEHLGQKYGIPTTFISAPTGL